MKQFKKLFYTLLVVLFCMFIMPICLPNMSNIYTVQAADLNTYGKTLTKGSTYTLKMVGTSKKPTWSSSNKKVATVNSKGKVTAVGNGVAFITAKIGRSEYICKIVVKSTPSISTKSKTLIKGATYTLKMKNTTKKITWSSNNKKIATVNSKGKVTAVSKGTTYIKAKVGGKTYSCKLIVESPYLNKKSYVMLKEKTYTLKLNGTTQKTTWSSSNKKIATVNSKGKVTAVSKGTTYIKAKVGGKTYSCKLTVENPYFSSKSVSTNSASIKKMPLNGTSKAITYKSSNTSIARVNSSGTLYSIKEGTAKITATVDSKTYTYTVTVKKNPSASGWKTLYSKKYYYEEGTPLTGLQTIDDRKYFFAPNGILTSKFGIDVSEWQETIDWEKAKADGVEFAILRCGYGMDQTDQDDSQFKRNISECKRLGIPFGVYLYSYANTLEKANSEADHVLRLIKGYKPSLGIWYDIEDKIQSDLEPKLLTNIINTFCKKIQNKGYSVGIYSSTNWLENIIDPSITKKYPVWVAQYYDNCEYSGEYVMWQYTSDGAVDGINTRVDLNIMF